MTIVPPASTVTFEPSPKAATASSAVLGTMTSLRLVTAARSYRFAGLRWTSRVFGSIHDDRRASGGAARCWVPRRPRARHRSLPRDGAREAATARRRGGRREDRGGEGDGARTSRTPHPTPMLRGARCRPRRVRVELLATAAPHPSRSGRHGKRGGALPPRVPDPPAVARGDRKRGTGRPADRRDRPR